MRLILSLVIAMLMVTGVAFAQPANPPNKDEARKHFEEGLAHFDRGEWSAALAEFLASRRLFPTRPATKDAAICLRKESRFDESLEMWEALEKEFPDVSPEDKALTDREIADLQRSVGSVNVTGGEPGASIVVDGRDRGTLPLSAPLRVSAGSRVVRVTKEGFIPFETHIDIAGQQTTVVEAKLAPLTQGGRLRVTEQEGLTLDVLVDNAVVGKTPWEGTLPAGDHVVILRGEGNLGTQPVNASIRLNEVTPLTLASEALEAAARVEPTPGGATVAVDGVVVGRGVWEGRLRAGGHKFEAVQDGFLPFSQQVSIAKGERQVVVATLERDPNAGQWGKKRASKVVLEVGGGFSLSPVFFGDIGSGCTGTCSTDLPLGGTAWLRIAYELPQGVAFGLDGGFLALSSSVTGRPATISGARMLASDSGPVTDKVNAIGARIGLSAAYHTSNDWPVTLRLGIGVYLPSVTDHRTGNFVTSNPATPPFPVPPNAPYTVDVSESHLGAYLYAAPEVRIGRRFGDHFELSIGVEAMVMTGLLTPQWKDTNQVVAGPLDASGKQQPGDGAGGFGVQTIMGSFLFAVTPGLAARYAF